MRYSSDIVVIDLEASCARPGDNEIEQSNILEIGAVRLDRRTLETVDRFQQLVHPRDHPVLPAIAELTGITPEMVAEAPTFDEVFPRFAAWYGPRNRSVLAAWGVYYDLPLLRKECRVFGVDFRKQFVGAALDVRSLAIGWLAQRDLNTTGITLEVALRRMGIEAPSRSHRALDDAESAAAVLRRVHREASG